MSSILSIRLSVLLRSHFAALAHRSLVLPPNSPSSVVSARSLLLTSTRSLSSPAAISTSSTWTTRERRCVASTLARKSTPTHWRVQVALLFLSRVMVATTEQTETRKHRASLLLRVTRWVASCGCQVRPVCSFPWYSRDTACFPSVICWSDKRMIFHPSHPFVFLPTHYHTHKFTKRASHLSSFSSTPGLHVHGS